MRTLTIKDIVSTHKQRAGICPICKLYFSDLTEHHIHKRAVFGLTSDCSIYICEFCHPIVEKEITRREGIVLRSYQKDIYEDVILSFVEGSIKMPSHKSKIRKKKRKQNSARNRRSRH